MLFKKYIHDCTKIYSSLNFALVKPRIIEMPRVRILGEINDTPARQFPVATALQLTCEGQVGSDASKVRAKNYYYI